MNNIITRGKAKLLLHKLKCSNNMFFLQYEKNEGERKHILCRLGLTEDKMLLKHNYDPTDYNSLEVFDSSLQAFIEMSISDVIFIRYNDIRYFVLPN